MNISQRLRTCAKHTGLDAVIELLQEAADEIDALQARAQVQGEPVTVAVDHFDNGPFEAYTNRIHPPVEIGTKLYTTPQPAQATQAEAQQPATDEPVVDVRCEGCGYMTHHREHMGCVRAAKQHTHPATGEPVGYMNEGHIHELAMGRIPYGYVYPEAGTGASTAVYTHPAPSGLGDSKRLDYLQDRGATIDLIAGVAAFYPMRFRVGGLHSSANIDVRAAIDAAMLAAMLAAK